MVQKMFSKILINNVASSQYVENVYMYVKTALSPPPLLPPPIFYNPSF